ncbi:uncharacterized protein LOC122504604 [Leptopilina heterotoma]|uniref:uncharacterized protein LOC122504604 n=1 Tax=Leptopilina heterotoma TaxID=63436 RepID=UPI001CA8F703|nr:uncharacterized protein LOC122504604 [Leptopilina heterotoma]
MACSNPIICIFWLLVLVFVSFIVAFFLAPFYVIVHCLTAFISGLDECANLLLKGVQFPHHCAKQMCNS